MEGAEVGKEAFFGFFGFPDIDGIGEGLAKMLLGGGVAGNTPAIGLAMLVLNANAKEWLVLIVYYNASIHLPLSCGGRLRRTINILGLRIYPPIWNKEAMAHPKTRFRIPTDSRILPQDTPKVFVFMCSTILRDYVSKCQFKHVILLF